VYCKYHRPESGESERVRNVHANPAQRSAAHPVQRPTRQQQGTHAALLAADGAYARLYTAQFVHAVAEVD